MISRVGIEGLNSKEKVLHNLYFDFNKPVNASKKFSDYVTIATSKYLK